jgi:probable HAF family extracellular repeat protein
MQDIGTSAGPQCSSADANNSGQVVGTCVESSGSTTGFFAPSPGSAVTLTELTNSRSCAASAITNSGRIVGTCLDSDSLPTSVIWSTTTTTSPQELGALAGAVRSQATAYNEAGALAGVSIESDGIALPVMWRNGETTARMLPVGLLGLTATNCSPADVDNVAADPNFPTIVGNCPGTSGRPKPILWTKGGLLSSYVDSTLPLPAGAGYCTTRRINNGRILGNCDFGAQGSKTVLWSTPAVAPTVLITTPGRNSGRALNANGAVIGHYVNGTGDFIPYYWDTTTNTRTDIPTLDPNEDAGVTAIADNGAVVGTSEVSAGPSHAISWSLAGGTVDLGTLPGGENSRSSAISSNGCYMTGSSETGVSNAVHAVLTNLCGSGSK